MKKFADDMRWKEASKVRKLKSQIRSRKIVESQRSKLAIDGNSRSQHLEYLHERHAGRVVTRKQIDTEISTMGPRKNKEREKRDQEKRDRAKRLEKRERRLKGRRGARDESEYDDEVEYMPVKSSRRG